MAAIPSRQGVIRTYKALKFRGNRVFGIATIEGMDETADPSKFGRWRDLDPSRACALCGRPGLHWKNTTGKCAKCFRKLPTVAKVSNTTEARGVLQHFAKQLVDLHGLAASAQMLGLDPRTTLAVTRGEAKVVAADAAGAAAGSTSASPVDPAAAPASGSVSAPAPDSASATAADAASTPAPGSAPAPAPGSASALAARAMSADASSPPAPGSGLVSAPGGTPDQTSASPAESRPQLAPARQLTAADLGLPPDHPLAGVRLDPDVLAEVVRRYRDLEPLHPTLAAVIAPWRRAMRVEIAKETPGDRTRRLNRAKGRGDLVRYVPPPDAPLDPSQPSNALGCDPAASHLPEHKLPMRVALGLWALGFGAGGISKIADRARRPVSKSVVHRMLDRARFKFAGGVPTKLRELTAELNRRPATSHAGDA